MSNKTDDLGLMRIQIVDGPIHTVQEVLQMVIEFLDELDRGGDLRGRRYLAMVAAVDIALKEFGEALPTEVTAILKEMRPKTFNAIVHVRSLAEAVGVDDIDFPRS